MATKRQQGFTLIELVVAMAIFSVCVAMGLGVMSYALQQRVVNTTVLAIQDAFTTASATMVEEIKGAAGADYTGAVEENAFILAPKDTSGMGATGDELIFLMPTTNAKGDPCEERIRYFTGPSDDGTEGTAILKQKDLVTTDSSNYRRTKENTDPVTPYINLPLAKDGRQAVMVNFVNNKGKITIIMKAELTINEQVNDITYIATAYARNYVPAIPAGGPMGRISGPIIGLINTLYSYTADFSGGQPFVGQPHYIYTWSDGETEITNVASKYMWTKPGTYTPMVTVTDALGRSGEAQGPLVKIQSTLTVFVSPEETGTVALSPTGRVLSPTEVAYDKDDGVWLTASSTANYADYVFSGWSGDDVPSGHEGDNPLLITMNGDKMIMANFSPIIP